MCFSLLIFFTYGLYENMKKGGNWAHPRLGFNQIIPQRMTSKASGQTKKEGPMDWTFLRGWRKIINWTTKLESRRFWSESRMLIYFMNFGERTVSWGYMVLSLTLRVNGWGQIEEEAIADNEIKKLRDHAVRQSTHQFNTEEFNIINSCWKHLRWWQKLG